MIICLTGFMGCGKSSVGRRLSELLCCPFMDLDQVIEERTGRTIPEIFATDGEAAFRAMETETLRDIISCCGQERLPKQSLPSQAMGPSLCGPPTSITSEPRQCAPLAPSHSKAAGPSPYAGVRKCQFRTNALTPDCHPEYSTCYPETPNCHPEAPDCHPERSEGSVNLVLALGGGTVMTPECAELVHSHTHCIYLRATVDTLVSHLEHEAAGRPMLNTDTANCHFDQAKRVEKSAMRERITTLMSQRSATYEKTAHVILDTDGKSIEAIASEIISMLNKYLAHFYSDTVADTL